MRDGRSLDTLDTRGDGHRYYSSFGSNRHHDRHRYHPYRRSDREYLSDEFKITNPHTFDGDLKKTKICRCLDTWDEQVL